MKLVITKDGIQIVNGVNYMAVPRVGDTLEMQNFKIKVKDVIWHIEDTTWVEVQV